MARRLQAGLLAAALGYTLALTGCGAAATPLAATHTFFRNFFGGRLTAAANLTTDPQGGRPLRSAKPIPSSTISSAWPGSR